MKNIVITILLLAAAGGLLLDRVDFFKKSGDAGRQLATQSISEETEARFPLDTRSVDRENVPRVTSYSDILDAARPAVVSVATARVVRVFQGGSRSPMEEFLRRFYGLPSPRENREGSEFEERRLPGGFGSGVIVSEDGYILTNNHVVTDDRGEPVDEIRVTLTDGREFEAELVGRDEKTDVALLKVGAEELPFLPMADPENLRVGDIVFAVGNPLGVGQTVTMGIVSATGRSRLGLLGNQGYEDFIQTDASINPGNSGGALIDADGRLIGINTAILSRTGGNIGIGFAIPINLARYIVMSLIETGSVQRGFIGVAITDLDADMAEAFGVDSPRGALVESVQEGLPAEVAGIERGDVIVEIGGEAVEDVADLRLRIASMLPGSDVEIKVIRDREEKVIPVILGSLENPEASIGGMPGESPLEGVTFGALSRETRQQYEISSRVDGLLITDVEGSSPYAASLREGMVIIEVNDETVTSLDDLRNALVLGAVNKLWVFFNGTSGYIALRAQG